MFIFFSVLAWLAGTNAHLSAFHKSMYCINGTQKGVDNQNANVMVNPMYQMELSQWWFQNYSGCADIPPSPGDSLELPAGGSFTVEVATNRAFTSLSYDGNHTSQWTDGGNYTDLYNPNNTQCITSPNLHTQNQSMAAGTAFAISYQSNLSTVTQENLVIFSVLPNTPFERMATFDVPAKMPPCPPEGCICAWGWIPNGCGEPNMYMQGFKCNVTNSTSNTPLATPKPPVWCEGDPKNCTQGAKQFLSWNQLSGNNIEVVGFDLAGGNKSPGYNSKCGFSNGAQNDIFAEPASVSSKRRTADDDEDTNTNSIKADISSHRRNSPSFRPAKKRSHWFSF